VTGGPLRRLVVLVVRIFFRRVAVIGAEHVPPSGPVLFVLNHPNSLVDPLFLLGLAPRRVVFLAKEPLFRIPVIGWLTRSMGSIPVYRRQDGADTSQNRRTFEKVWEELARGGAIALFPEGVSHSDPKVRPFKTGTARMALGAASLNASLPVSIVPAGLYYTAKVRFRSSAVLCFGDSVAVPSRPLGPEGEPHPDDVRALTARLEHSLAQVTLQADQEEALRLVARAERVFSSVHGPGTQDRDLARQFELRQRFLRGYTQLKDRAPARLEAVEHLLARYDAELIAAGLAPEHMLGSRLTPAMVTRNATIAVVTLVLLAVPAVIGIIIHFPGYQLLIPLITRAANVQRDVVATAKIFAAAAAFPLTWLVLGTLAWTRLGAGFGIATVIAAPCCGYAALLFMEGLDRLVGSARGLALRLFRPMAFKRLEAQRRRIRDEILALDAEIGR
jgi:glycerol-3-phosphate O-acyltransferase/dihydroxyacetone phosphate acyltransferase